MAEAIARHLLAAETVKELRNPGGHATGAKALVLSAGVHAGDGEPATPEARAALKRIGIEMGPHRSRTLTRRMIGEADRVFTMTDAHRRSILALDPEAGDKADTIDPDGDIPDPIGGPEEVYAETARRLLEAIRGRLAAEGLITAG